MGAAQHSIQDSQARACNCTHPSNHLKSAHTFTQTHLEHMGCAPGARDLEVAGSACLQRCHHLCHLLCHLLRRGAVQELACARVEQVLLELRCAKPGERPLRRGCLAILLRLLPLKLCGYPAVLDHSATPLSCYAHYLPGLWEVVLAVAGQAGPSSTDPGPHEPS